MNRLWRNSPWNLLRFPLLALAVCGAAALTTAVSTSGPTYMNSVEAGSLRESVQAATRWTAGIRITYSTYFFLERPAAVRQRDLFSFIERMSDVLDKRLEDAPGVDELNLSVVGSALTAGPSRSGAQVKLAFRSRFRDHIDQLEGSGPGLWIADSTAQQLDIQPGEVLKLTSPEGTASTEVAGVYRYLSADRERPFWKPFDELIYRETGEFFDPPALMFADEETYRELMIELDDFGSVTFLFPLRSTGLSMELASSLSSEFAEISKEMQSAESELNKSQGSFVRKWAEHGDVQSGLSTMVAGARQRVRSLAPGIDLMTGTALLVVLAVTASVGLYLVKRRRVECAALCIRGSGPCPQALRYGVEALLPAVLGGTLGVVAIRFAIGRFGPSPDLGSENSLELMAVVWRPLMLGHLLLVVAAGLSVRREERALSDAGRTRAGARWLLGATVVMGLAAGILLNGREGLSVTSLEAVSDPLLTLEPMVLVIAGAMLSATFLKASIPSLALRVRSKAPTVYLAMRRIVGSSALSLSLMAAVASALGITVYALASSETTERSAIAKSRLFVGSDVSISIPPNLDVPDMPFPATQTREVERAALATGEQVRILAIDPSSFEDAVYWQADFATQPLEELLRGLDSDGTTVPVLMTRDIVSNGSLGTGDDRISLTVTGVIDGFPGVARGNGLVVMSLDSLDRALPSVSSSGSGIVDEILVKAPIDRVEDFLRRAAVPHFAIMDAHRVLQTPALQSLLWMLDILILLGASTACVSVISLILYLQAKQRTALVSGLLTRRMGLSRRSELLTWGFEVGGMLLASLGVATISGIAAAWLLIDALDPRPTLLPRPELAFPTGGIVTLLLLTLVVSVACTYGIGRRIDSSDPASVMRE